MFDPILDSIKENDKQLKEQEILNTSKIPELASTQHTEDTDETSSDIPVSLKKEKEDKQVAENLSPIADNKGTIKDDHADISDFEPISRDFVISYFRENLEEVLSLSDGDAITRKQGYFSLIRKLFLVKTGMFPNVLELFQIDYAYKKKPIYKDVSKNYMYEKLLGEHVVHYDLRYNLKTEHINYFTFLLFSLVSSKAISRVNKDKLLSDPYFAFSTLYQIILYNFSILNMYNTFQYNAHVSSQKKRFHPLIDLDLDSDRDEQYPVASTNFQFKPEYTKQSNAKVVQDKPIMMEYNKITDYLWKIPFGQGNYKMEDSLIGHPQADKLNGFQVLFFLNKWCQSNGNDDPNGLATLIEQFVGLLHSLNVKMKKENQLVALILWLTALISYGKESDMEFQANILKMILDDPSFGKFDSIDFDLSYNQEELEICEKEQIARQSLRASKNLTEKLRFQLAIDGDGSLKFGVEPKQVQAREQPNKESEILDPLPNKDNIVLIKNDSLLTDNTPPLTTTAAAEEPEYKTENHSCVTYLNYYNPKHIINVTNTKSKNNFKKQLNKEISLKLNNLYKDKTIDQLVYDLNETQKIAATIRTKSSNYMKLFDKHEINYVALTSGKFGGRTKKNPKINDSVVGFQTDMVKLFRMNKMIENRCV